MKKKTKKRLISLLVLALVIVALIIGIAVMNSINNKADEEKTPEAQPTHETVFDKGTSIVTAIHFKDSDTEMSFSYINDEWVYDADPNFPLYRDRVASMAQSVSKIDAAVIIKDNKKPLSDFGLESAAVTVDVTYSDGSEKTFLFGSKNSFNSCQYLSISGDSNIYMVEENVAEPFAADLDYLYDPETFVLQKDGVDYTSVDSVTLVTAKGESKEITDVEGIYSLTELILKLDLSTYEDYYADEAEMAETYLISPEGDRIIVSYTSIEGEEKEYVVYIGAMNEPEPEKETEEGAEDETSSDSEEATSPETDTAAPETDTAAPDEETKAPEDGEEESKYFYFYTFNESTVVYNADGETVDEIFTYLTYTPKTETE